MGILVNRRTHLTGTCGQRGNPILDRDRKPNVLTDVHGYIDGHAGLYVFSEFYRGFPDSVQVKLLTDSIGRYARIQEGKAAFRAEEQPNAPRGIVRCSALQRAITKTRD